MGSSNVEGNRVVGALTGIIPIESKNKKSRTQPGRAGELPNCNKLNNRVEGNRQANRDREKTTTSLFSRFDTVLRSLAEL